jgi:hypothetical protein
MSFFEFNLRANAPEGKRASQLSWIMCQPLKPHGGVGEGAVCRSVEGLGASALNCNVAVRGAFQCSGIKPAPTSSKRRSR